MANFMGKPLESLPFSATTWRWGTELDKTDLTCGEMLHVFVINGNTKK
jgi:hypothetical protein